MKKTLFMIALGAVVLFSGCSDDDADPNVDIATESTDITYNQATIPITVQTSDGWLTSSSASWITVPDEYKSGGKGDKTVNFIVSPNINVNPVASRTSTISFTSIINGKFSRVEVKQEELPATADLTPYITDSKFSDFLKAEFNTSIITYPQTVEYGDMDLAGEGVESLNYGIEFFIKLAKLNCSDNNIADLNLSTAPELTDLNCADNDLTKLTIADCKKLVTLNCANNSLNSIDLEPFENMTTFDISNNKMVELDLSKCPSLVDVNCRDNTETLTGITLTDCDNLETLDLANNQGIAVLNVASCTSLTSLICSNTSIATLDISSNTGLTTLDATACPLLTSVKVWDGFDTDNPPAGFQIPAGASYTK